MNVTHQQPSDYTGLISNNFPEPLKSLKYSYLPVHFLLQEFHSNSPLLKVLTTAQPQCMPRIISITAPSGTHSGVLTANQTADNPAPKSHFFSLLPQTTPGTTTVLGKVPQVTDSEMVICIPEVYPCKLLTNNCGRMKEVSLNCNAVTGRTQPIP